MDLKGVREGVTEWGGEWVTERGTSQENHHHIVTLTYTQQFLFTNKNWIRKYFFQNGSKSQNFKIWICLFWLQIQIPCEKVWMYSVFRFWKFWVEEPQIVKNGQFLVDILPNAHLLTKFHVFHDFDNANIFRKEYESAIRKKEFWPLSVPLTPPDSQYKIFKFFFF